MPFISFVSHSSCRIQIYVSYPGTSFQRRLYFKRNSLLLLQRNTEDAWKNTVFCLIRSCLEKTKLHQQSSISWILNLLWIHTNTYQREICCWEQNNHILWISLKYLVDVCFHKSNVIRNHIPFLSELGISNT